jgi:methanethiol S-methyltransferase
VRPFVRPPWQFSHSKYDVITDDPIIQRAAPEHGRCREGLPMAIIVGLIYLVLLAAVLYATLFVGNLAAPRTIDFGPTAAPLQAWMIDLLALVALAAAAGIRPRPTRSAHGTALLAGVVLTAFFIVWRPLPQIIWAFGGAPAGILRVLFYLGWTLVLIGVFIDRSRPFGSRAAAPMHPGLMLALWATPCMTVGHLLLAGSATAYVLVAALLAQRRSSRTARISKPLVAGVASFASERSAFRSERR